MFVYLSDIQAEWCFCCYQRKIYDRPRESCQTKVKVYTVTRMVLLNVEYIFSSVQKPIKLGTESEIYLFVEFWDD